MAIGGHPARWPGNSVQEYEAMDNGRKDRQAGIKRKAITKVSTQQAECDTGESGPPRLFLMHMTSPRGESSPLGDGGKKNPIPDGQDSQIHAGVILRLSFTVSDHQSLCK